MVKNVFQIDSSGKLNVNGHRVSAGRYLRVLLAGGLALMAASCNLLPSDGPTTTDIMASKEDDSLRKYLVVDLSDEVVSLINTYQEPPFSKRFSSARPATGQVIGIGDVLNISVFEAGQGGLFSSDSGARIQFPITVGSSGMITIPYAGEIKAAGRTTEALEKAIIAGLDGKAIQPQALVTISQNVANTVVVSGDVAKPGRYPLVASGDRVLDAVATAGGSRYSAYESQVLLVRGGTSGAVSVNQLMHSTADNVYVRPGDKIFVTRSPLAFTVFGSTKRTGTIPFDTENITLLEALGKASGLNGATSDVSGLFVFRYETDRVARAMVQGYDGRFGEKVPVVYRVNMKEAKSYFYANSFLIRSKDVMYVSSAPGAQLQKFTQILAGVNTVASTGVNLERLGQ
jgi:polysaccharide export outer membrane protein